MLDHVGYIDLPPHAKAGGFDHASVHRRTGRVYVAHTANDAVDVIDGSSGRFVESITGLPGVAGALVSDEDDLVFTSNRAENTVGVFDVAMPQKVVKIGVGIRPNGLAYDSARHRLLAAHVGSLEIAGSFTVSIDDPGARAGIADVAVGDPGVVEVFDTRSLTRVQTVVTEKDAHTLAFDAGRNTVYAFLPATHRAAVYIDRG